MVLASCGVCHSDVVNDSSLLWHIVSDVSERLLPPKFSDPEAVGRKIGL